MILTSLLLISLSLCLVLLSIGGINSIVTKSLLKFIVCCVDFYPNASKHVIELHFSGYLYNYQTKEFYNLSYASELPEGSARFGGLLMFLFYLQLFCVFGYFPVLP